MPREGNVICVIGLGCFVGLFPPLKVNDQASKSKWIIFGTSLLVQWLRPWLSTARSTGLISGPGTKIPHYMQYEKNKIFKLLIKIKRPNFNP